MKEKRRGWPSMRNSIHKGAEGGKWEVLLEYISGAVGSQGPLISGEWTGGERADGATSCCAVQWH